MVINVNSIEYVYVEKNTIFVGVSTQYQDGGYWEGGPLGGQIQGGDKLFCGASRYHKLCKHEFFNTFTEAADYTQTVLREKYESAKKRVAEYDAAMAEFLKRSGEPWLR